MTNEELIIENAKKYGGVIKTSQIEELGISRANIKRLVESGSLIREARGIYSIPSEITDEYLTLGRRSDKLVFSYGTALFFHGLSDRVPGTIEISLPQGYNAGRLKKDYTNLRIHYVKPEILMLGADRVITPQGSKVMAYNKERCICDLIKNESKADKQVYTQAIKEYFAGEYKPRDLLKMAKTIGVEREIRRYMEVL